MTGKKKKCIAAIICILFVFVTFASLFYIVKEADHESTGENCPICACVHQAHQTLKNLGTGTIIWSGTIFTILFTLCVFMQYVCMILNTSLVSQKVRLND